MNAPLLLQSLAPNADPECFMPTGSLERLIGLLADAEPTTRLRLILDADIEEWDIAIAGAAARVVRTVGNGQPTPYVTSSSLLPVAAVDWFRLGDRGRAPAAPLMVATDWLTNPGGEPPPGATSTRLTITQPGGSVGIAIVHATPFGYYWGPIIEGAEQVLLAPGTGLNAWLQVLLIA